jgi:hypothetical protein
LSDAGSVFTGCSSNLQICVPSSASVSAYKTASYWKAYESMIVSQ